MNDKIIVICFNNITWC